MPAPTIDSVETLERDPGFCRIRVGKRAFEPLRRDDAERLGVRAGRRWTASLAKSIGRLIETEDARRAALTALGRSTLSRERLQARLEAKGLAPASVRSALDELARAGWLDDRRAARERAGAISRRLTVAQGALETLLEEEGFARDAHRAAAESLAGATDLDRAVREASKSTVRSRGAAAVARHLARRGFDSDTIETAMRRCGLRLESDELP